ncbi:hypothetical protein BN1180_01713 [Peribacillus simplex]|uniref:Uncharacterized protein n=2 Tax=Bacillales TaxID=1385 RepID=A0AAN2PFS5_9BACI|nr:hypothetical protein BN1180_01713 [Peribacillus simplex]
MHVNFGHLLVIWVILMNFDQILVSFGVLHVNFGHFLLIWSNTREFRSILVSFGVLLVNFGHLLVSLSVILVNWRKYKK